MTIPLSIKGDGVTEGADIAFVFSTTRLKVNHPVGALPINGSGQCSWNGVDRVAGIIFNGASSPLSSGTTLVCSFQMRILSNARVGTTVLRAAQTNCANGAAKPVTCTLQGGAITVLGPAPPPPAAASAPSNTELLIELAPSEAMAAATSDGAKKSAGLGGDLVAFRSVPPRLLRPMRQGTRSDERQARHLREPDTLDAKFARTVVARFDTPEEMKQAQALLERDPRVSSITPGGTVPFNSATSGTKTTPNASAKAVGVADAQTHLSMLTLEPAWTLSKGWSLIGMLDNGIDANRPELRSFTGSGSVGGNFVVGGNYLPHLSENLAVAEGQIASKLDENQTQTLAAGQSAACDQSDGALDGKLSYDYAGHGTHVAGLIGANAADMTGVSGTCVNCGVAVRKVSYLYCGFGPSVALGVNQTYVTEGMRDFAELGAQVVNFSGGYSYSCGTPPYDSNCNAVFHLGHLDVMLVASSGNNLTDVNYPARMMDAVSVGGVDGTGTYWDQRPNDCPYSGSLDECGSNYNKTPSNLNYKQDLTAMAKDVWSTFMPGVTWQPDIDCGDDEGNIGTGTDGFGPCTGTSMSSPQVAGVFGLVRSVNPLMTVGSPFYPTSNPFTRTVPSNPFVLDAYGVRDLIAQTTNRSQQGLGNSPTLGFGIPNANAAVRKALGTVRGAQMVNRLTPLFALYSPTATDYAAVATPQMAQALSYFHASAFRSIGSASLFVNGNPVPGYPKFPYEYHSAAADKSPRAFAMVLTTHVSPVASSPPVVPLYLMERRPAQGAPDFILVSSTSVLQSASNAGYRYLGQQGYVYSHCTPSPTCTVPPGAQALHLKCNNTAGIQDCAVFLEAQAASFTAKGYTALFSNMSKSQLGYAYPVEDKENNNAGDGLVDALETIIGTSTAHTDSDGDGMSDSAEYPLANPPVSDPCQGPVVVCTRPPWYVFASSFE